ncbi:MAG: hypothetical protein Q4D98_04410 [Planctomycetia bacterium]|nr:hypothetical protein [Planctomycetia bacterium]
MTRQRKSGDGGLSEIRLVARVTEAEAEAIRQKAKDAGVTVSELLTAAALNWKPSKQKPLSLPARLQHLADRGAVERKKTIRQKLP